MQLEFTSTDIARTVTKKQQIDKVLNEMANEKGLKQLDMRIKADLDSHRREPLKIPIKSINTHWEISQSNSVAEEQT